MPLCGRSAARAQQTVSGASPGAGSGRPHAGSRRALRHAGGGRQKLRAWPEGERLSRLLVKRPLRGSPGRLAAEGRGATGIFVNSSAARLAAQNLVPAGPGSTKSAQAADGRAPKRCACLTAWAGRGRAARRPAPRASGLAGSAGHVPARRHGGRGCATRRASPGRARAGRWSNGWPSA